MLEIDVWRKKHCGGVKSVKNTVKGASTIERILCKVCTFYHYY